MDLIELIKKAKEAGADVNLNILYDAFPNEEDDFILEDDEAVYVVVRPEGSKRVKVRRDPNSILGQIGFAYNGDELFCNEQDVSTDKEGVTFIYAQYVLNPHPNWGEPFPAEGGWVEKAYLVEK